MANKHFSSFSVIFLTSTNAALIIVEFNKTNISGNNNNNTRWYLTVNQKCFP